MLSLSDGLDYAPVDDDGGRGDGVGALLGFRRLELMA